MSVAGISALAMALLVWLLPMRSGLLEFSQAEIAFLFPAPVSRRQLLLHRIVRSQVGSLFVAIVMAIVLAPASGFGRFRFAIAMWALFVTVRVYFAAVTLTRARFSSAVASVRRAAWLPIAVLAIALVTVGVAVARELMSVPASGALDFAVRIARATATGPPSIVLWPFKALLDPLLETSWTSFAVSMAGSLVVLAAVTAWMLMSDATFDLAAGEAGEPQERSRERARTIGPRARNVGWTLALTGRLESAFLWKNAMQTIRSTNARALRFVAPAIGAMIGLSAAAMGAGRLRGPAAFICFVAASLSGAAVLFGPQWMQHDLRGDFEHLDLLKTWPVRPGDLIRGEIAWPALVVSACAWLGIVSAGIFSGPAFPDVTLVDRWAFIVSAVFVAPALVAAQYTIHNAIALFFPAWVPSGVQRTRGIDAMGQRLDHAGGYRRRARHLRTARRPRRLRGLVRAPALPRYRRVRCRVGAVCRYRARRSARCDRAPRPCVRTAGLAVSGAGGMNPVGAATSSLAGPVHHEDTKTRRSRVLFYKKSFVTFVIFVTS